MRRDPQGEDVEGWRYLLDADKAANMRLAVGMRSADGGDEFTVRLRNSVILVEDGISDDVVVEVTSMLLSGADTDVSAKTTRGDPDSFTRLVACLDREVVGFSMHQR